MYIKPQFIIILNIEFVQTKYLQITRTLIEPPQSSTDVQTNWLSRVGEDTTVSDILYIMPVTTQYYLRMVKTKTSDL